MIRLTVLAGCKRAFEVRNTVRRDGCYGIVSPDTLDTLGFFVELVDSPVAEHVEAMVEDI
jgi:hypothetical protein